MKIVFISDTHSLEYQVQVPDGDILVHCGDFMNTGREIHELYLFSNWWNLLPHKHKILVYGNHDVMAQKEPALVEAAFENTHILLDSGVEIEGIKFWGSPYTPDFYRDQWAFNASRGDEIKQHWDLIPYATDVLLTHGPPFGILDQMILGCTERPKGYPSHFSDPSEHLGCEDLAEAVYKICPKIHSFGHIHGSYGTQQFGNVKFINASQVDEKYRVVNKPIVVEI